MSEILLALLCVAGGILHLLAARVICRGGMPVPAALFAVSGVVQLAFAVALVRNGAPGG